MPSIDEVVAKRGVQMNVPILGAKKEAKPALVALATVIPGAAAAGVPAMFFSLWTQAVRNAAIFPIVQISGPNVEHARNKACEIAMASPATHLLFIDADEVWDNDDMWAFINRANEKQYDVVSGVVNKLTQVSVSEFYTHPSIYDENLRPIEKPEEGGYQEVPNVGAGALLISKRLIVNMRGKWFDREGTLGEDLSFSKHVRDMNIKMYVDWDWELGHIKQLLI